MKLLSIPFLSSKCLHCVSDENVLMTWLETKLYFCISSLSDVSPGSHHYLYFLACQRKISMTETDAWNFNPTMSLFPATPTVLKILSLQHFLCNNTDLARLQTANIPSSRKRIISVSWFQNFWKIIHLVLTSVLWLVRHVLFPPMARIRRFLCWPTIFYQVSKTKKVLDRSNWWIRSFSRIWHLRYEYRCQRYLYTSIFDRTS